MKRRYAVWATVKTSYSTKCSLPGTSEFLKVQSHWCAICWKKIRTAVVSASKNCEDILIAAGIVDLFEVQVDGKVAETLSLPSKPDPAAFLKAAELLEVDPSRAIVIEDAIVGVQAGRKGNFGLVVGVDRHGDAPELKKNGADIVVSDLAELLPG